MLMLELGHIYRQQQFDNFSHLQSSVPTNFMVRSFCLVPENRGRGPRCAAVGSTASTHEATPTGARGAQLLH
eukprot:511807-Pleurochrysis_carterae.AAC.2